MTVELLLYLTFFTPKFCTNVRSRSDLHSTVGRPNTIAEVCVALLIVGNTPPLGRLPPVCICRLVSHPWQSVRRASSPRTKSGVVGIASGVTRRSGIPDKRNIGTMRAIEIHTRHLEARKVPNRRGIRGRVDELAIFVQYLSRGG